jgi:uncharacterized protein YndB with AHSA1/START domain
MAAADRVLELTRILDAPRALVFRAWTEPEHLARWWGPQGFVTTELAADIRPGGAYRAVMRSPAGTVYCRRGVYREIAAPDRLVFTYAWEDAQGEIGPETLVTVRFEAIGEQTRLTLRQKVFATASACASHREGWTSCLERFALYLVSAMEGARP